MSVLHSWRLLFYPQIQRTLTNFNFFFFRLSRWHRPWLSIWEKMQCDTIDKPCLSPFKRRRFLWEETGFWCKGRGTSSWKSFLSVTVTASKNKKVFCAGSPRPETHWELMLSIAHLIGTPAIVWTHQSNLLDRPPERAVEIWNLFPEKVQKVNVTVFLSHCFIFKYCILGITRRCTFTCLRWYMEGICIWFSIYGRYITGGTLEISGGNCSNWLIGADLLTLQASSMYLSDQGQK